MCVQEDRIDNTVQPLNSSFISRVKSEDATVQFIDGTALHDVGHHFNVTAGTQLG